MDDSLILDLEVYSYVLLCSCWTYLAMAVPISTVPSTVQSDEIQLITQVTPVEISAASSAENAGTGRAFAGTARVLPFMFGDVLQSLPFLPLNINVPDVFSGMYSLVNQYFGGNSNPRPTSGRRRNRNRNTITATTTTTTTAYPPELESLSREQSNRLTNDDFEEMYQEYMRKKDEFDKLKKKKKRKHKHDDMLEKIVSHLAYLELEC